MKKTTLVIAVLVLIISLGISMIACEKPIEQDDYVYDEDIKIEDPSLAKGADLRLMTYNIQVHAWGGKNREKPDERARRYEQMAMYYKPDVVALQEVCEVWHSHFTATIEANYEMMFDNPTNYTSMAYNKNTVELLDKGIVKYSKHHEKVIQMMRYIAFGVFKHKETGKTFICTSTHLDYHPNETTMNLQVDELSTFIKDKLEAYDNCPIFAMGDYNVQEKETSDPANCVEIYKTIAPKTGLTDVNYVEGLTHVDGPNCKWDTPKWDHIYVNYPENVKKFGIASQDYYKKVSDHYPTYIDVAL